MYIRTKDGIYKVSHYNAYATHKRKGETLLEGYKTSYIKNENIINQSENLEELCDCFVYFDITHKVHTVFSLEEYKKYKQDKYWTCDLHIWYGAVWTSKGLIYVAKMNDKGELELL